VKISWSVLSPPPG